MRKTLDFLLHDWLRIEDLVARPRYAEHSRDTFAAMLDACESLSRDVFAPRNREVDRDEPRLVDGRVVLPPAAHVTARAYVDSGMLSATHDASAGGLQLPLVVATAANALFAEAGVGLGGAGLLTVGNANLIMAHGSESQRRVFAAAQFAGRWFGTMCLSEPQAGSGLADITTRAVADPDGADDPLGPRYRLTGHKMWISNGDHELTENIVHLVLAKIPEADGRLPAGTRGISLFIVPKWLVDAHGALTAERNDVAVAGLNHKLGYRGIPNTLLNFGEGRYPARGGGGAIGYRVGAPGDGLRCMFHMMNEARIAVGLGAAALAHAGYTASLRYARERRQGRALGDTGKADAAGPARIIEHPDVKRMLLAQKAYAEGGLALSLYCARLVDEQLTGEPAAAHEATRLLELLTPVAKSWPSEWGLEANSLAIQVLGGYGYTRDFPVEQYWRDNRLNMIHEGTHGIQGLDLLGRKAVQDDGAALRLLQARIERTRARAVADGEFAAAAEAVAVAFRAAGDAVRDAWSVGNPAAALANATLFLQAFGHVVVAWLWLDLALTVVGRDDDRAQGVRQTARYFADYELPKVSAWLGPVAARNLTCHRMHDAWFDA